MEFRKPEWLDTAVGITGLVLAVFALLVGTRLSAAVSAYAAAGICIFIILVSVLFRPRHGLKTLAMNERETFLEEAMVDAEEIMLANPSLAKFNFTPHLDRALESNIQVTVIGCGPLLQETLKPLRTPVRERYLKTARVSDSLSDEPFVCIASRGYRKLTLLFIPDRDAVVLHISDTPIVKTILAIIRGGDDPRRSYARLDQASEMATLLDAFTLEQRRYLDNFSCLRQGQLSYHGTEVQQLQSSMVESGRFKRIDTLDITTAPDLLLLRRRYIDANASFVKHGGAIRRVYMIEGKKQHDRVFMDTLQELVRQQRAIGVDLGLVIIDDLAPVLRKDFILFDDALVLVEDRQANLDYSLGRSTAFFFRNDVEHYRAHFDDVWTGTIGGCTPSQRLDTYFPK